MTGALDKISSAASRGLSGSMPLLSHEAGCPVKRTTATAMRAMRTDAAGTKLRGRWLLAWAASLGREDSEVVPAVSSDDPSDTELQLLIVDGREEKRGVGAAPRPHRRPADGWSESHPHCATAYLGANPTVTRTTGTKSGLFIPNCSRRSLDLFD
jgi:hypothetical protein